MATSALTTRDKGFALVGRINRWLMAGAIAVSGGLSLIAANALLQCESIERQLMAREMLEVNDREQRRIGQDLHDGLGQLLAGMAFLGQALAQNITDIEQIVVRSPAKGVPLLIKDLGSIKIEPFTRQGAVSRDGRS